MNVALRAVHDALAAKGEPSARWLSLVAALTDRVGAAGRVDGPELRLVLRSHGCRGTAGEWLANWEIPGFTAAGSPLRTTI